MLFKLHWGGRGVKGEEWRKLLEEDFRPRLERMWASADYLHPRALLGYFPCYSEGNDIVVLDPEDRETVLTRFTCPRQPKGDRLCLADFYRPKDSGELDVVAVQAVTVGDEVTELMAKLEAEGEFAEQLFVHGLGVQTAEGLAEWLHWRVRNDLGIDVRQGRRYSWGYPAVPDQSEHLKVETLLNLEQIGMQISDGYAPIPEQSTLALVCHHPQAGYYGMRNGRLLARRLARTTSSAAPRATRRRSRMLRRWRAELIALVAAIAVGVGVGLAFGVGRTSDEDRVTRRRDDLPAGVRGRRPRGAVRRDQPGRARAARVLLPRLRDQRAHDDPERAQGGARRAPRRHDHRRVRSARPTPRCGSARSSAAATTCGSSSATGSGS